MANLKKPLPSNRPGLTAQHPLVTQLLTFLQTRSSQHQRFLLALSGGLDSCVLLHLLIQARQHLPFELQALHVHHGLSPHADAWAQFCLKQCADLEVRCTVTHVEVPKDSGLGIEHAARRLRYDALFNFQSDGKQADFVVTAHHQDDQAETLLLQLFRGAGTKGLAAMAAEDSARKLLRPLLAVPRQALSEYALAHDIQWCDDESNTDTRYERNYVRHEVLPVLEKRYPAVKSVLARSANHIAQAHDLLDELAAQDIGPLPDGQSLCLQNLSSLSVARAKNGLRWWLSQHQMAMPNAERLQEILKQLLEAKVDAKLAIQLHTSDFQHHRFLKRYQQRAYLIEAISTEPYDVLWQGEPEIQLPHGGRLVFSQATGQGLAIKIGLSKLRISNRLGGERFKPDAGKPTRTLKHLLQEANIPPWQREQIPLIYWQDTLACVPGIGIAHELKAADGEPGLRIEWQGN